MSRSLALTFALAALAALSIGCQPKIGDSCSSYINCDINGTRICDLASPHGYCTQRNCDVGTCPSAEAVCIQFGATLRVAETYCMRKCQHDSDCRTGDGYRCLSGSDVGAVSLDTDTKFCVVPPITAGTDAGVDGSTADAATTD